MSKTRTNSHGSVDDHDPVEAYLKYLNLTAIGEVYRAHAQRAAEAGQTHLEFLANLLDVEVGSKRERVAKTRQAAAKMPAIKTMDSWDWTWNGKTIKREDIIPLLDLSILADSSNLLLLGRQGLGKTHILLAIGYAACCRGISTLFTTTADMINRLYAATADRSLQKALAIYTRPTLLLIDELGCVPLSKEAGDLFFQVVAKRYEHGSIVLTCNRGFKCWGEIFADPVVAANIIERLVHHSKIVVLKGKSYRLKGKENLNTETEE